jgi:glycosyltransferase involved in cell wall biosynthesis
LLVGLRRQRFHEILIPQMTDTAFQHVNLYWLALLIGAPNVSIFPGAGARVVFARRALLRHALTTSADAALLTFDVPAFLVLLAFACMKPRRTVGAHARRRVLHVISHLGVGGAQRQLAAVVNATPPDRYDVDILAFTQADGDFARQWFTRPDVKVSCVTDWPRLRPVVLEIARRCRSANYDVVHSWLFFGNVVGVAAARLAGVPRVIASVRNLSLWKRTWYRRWWFRIADVLVARAADVVTVNADALAQDHARWALTRARHIEVVHNGLDPASLTCDRAHARRALRCLTGAAHDAVFVGTNGRLAIEKNHAAFLRVVQQLRQHHPNVHAVIIGDGPLRSDLEAAARDLEIDHAVTFAGECRHAPQLMAGFDVFLMTSAIEGFPNALLEAVFLGVPSIASDVGGCLDVLGTRDLVYSPGDDASATWLVRHLIANPEVARARAAAVRRRALEMFTAERTTAAWMALYERQGVSSASNPSGLYRAAASGTSAT